MNTIKSKWEHFEAVCLQEVSDQQRHEAYVAFYAGALSIFALMDRLANTLTDSQKAAVILQWKNELDIFKAERSAEAAIMTAQMRH